MERHKTQNNPVQEWINKDSKLSSILKEIEKRTSSIEEQAEMAFHIVAEEYNLPKMPQDIDYNIESEAEQTSIYENLGLVKYAFPENDPRGNVMTALYCSKENIKIDMKDFWEKAKGEGYSEQNMSGIGYLGENYNVHIKFVTKGETWSDYDFNLFTKFDTII